jgi:hypothetical protein
MSKLIIIIICSIGFCNQVKAQKYEQDVKSIDAIIHALYESISGEAGEKRDWERFKYLFAADAQLIPTSKNADGNILYRTMTPEAYIEMFSTRINTGFFEWELHRVTDEYSSIAHVFSTYITKQSKDGPITNRGINSIQLLKDNERYYIMTIFWAAENLGVPLPEKYLK